MICKWTIFRYTSLATYGISSMLLLLLGAYSTALGTPIGIFAFNLSIYFRKCLLFIRHFNRSICYLIVFSDRLWDWSTIKIHQRCNTIWQAGTYIEPYTSDIYSIDNINHILYYVTISASIFTLAFRSEDSPSLAGCRCKRCFVTDRRISILWSMGYMGFLFRLW